MNYVGKKVCHKKFGMGVITKQEKDCIRVRFGGEYRERMLGFPQCLNNSIEILDDREALLDELNKHGFEGFHHYTDFKNFLNVMKTKKLYSRSEAQNQGLVFVDAAQKSIIEKTEKVVKDKVRFYYKEETPTLYRNEGIRHRDDFGGENDKAHMPIPVLLLFKKELLFEPNTYISSGGCGSKNTWITDHMDEALRFDWNEIFRREPYGNVPYEVHNEITNKRNAEFLVSKEVDLSHLKAVIFRCEADKKHAEFLLGENRLFQVNPNKFTIHLHSKGKRNYLKKYYVRKEGAKRIVRLEFYQSPADYSHVVKQYFLDGSIEARKVDKHALEECSVEFSYEMNANCERLEYLLNNEVSAIWR